MANEIAKRMTLIDRVTPALSKIDRGILSNRKNVKLLSSVSNKAWSAMKIGAVGVAGAIAGLAYASKGWEESAKVQIGAETKLETVMRQRMNATDEMIKGIKNLTSEQQKLGVIGDELQLAGAQQLSTFLRTDDALKSLIPAMNNLAAQQKGTKATASDMVNIGNLMGKVMDGQVGALRRVGISFSEAEEKILKYGTEQEKAATLAQVITNNVGEMNKALAETDQGKIQQATNAIGDLKETLGTATLKIKAGLAEAFMEHMPRIEGAIQGIADRITTWADGGGIEKMINAMEAVGSAIESVWEVASSVAEFVSDNWNTISTILLGVAAAFAVVKVAFVAMSVAMFLSNPFGWIVTGIGLAIGAGVAIMKNWETVKEVAINVWNGIVGAVETGLGGFVGGVEFLVNVVINKINSVLEGINAVSNAMGAGDVIKKLDQADFGRPDLDWAKVSGKSDPIIDDMLHVDRVVGEETKKKQKTKEQTIQTQNQSMIDLSKALDTNTRAVGKNTSATNKNTETLKDSSALDIADSLFNRIDRNPIYGT